MKYQHPDTTENTLTSNCPLCGDVRIDRHRFGLMKCRTCGLVLDPAIFALHAATELNEDAFGESYDPETSFWVGLFHAWKCRRYLRNLARSGISEGALLEVGIGDGTFLRAARAAGFSVDGCDLSPSLCRKAEAKTGVHVYCSTLETLPAGPFDVIVMNHILEHVSDPTALLSAAYDKLHPGGAIHVAVPNIGCWEAGLGGWNSYLKYHVAYYTPATLRVAIIKSGLVPVFETTHDSFSTWFLTALRSLLPVGRVGDSRIAASIGRVPSWWPLIEHPYRMAMIVAGAVTWPLRALQSLIGRGDEAVVVARKPVAGSAANRHS